MYLDHQFRIGWDNESVVSRERSHSLLDFFHAFIRCTCMCVYVFGHRFEFSGSSILNIMCVYVFFSVPSLMHSHQMFRFLSNTFTSFGVCFFSTSLSIFFSLSLSYSLYLQSVSSNIHCFWQNRIVSNFIWN